MAKSRLENTYVITSNHAAFLSFQHGLHALRTVKRNHTTIRNHTILILSRLLCGFWLMCGLPFMSSFFWFRQLTLFIYLPTCRMAIPKPHNMQNKKRYM